MSLVLVSPAIDEWKPGEHTGTFRGNNLAFVAATEALAYWETPALADAIAARGRQLAQSLQEWVRCWPELGLKVRGAGLIWGLEFSDTALCQEVARDAFARGLVIETCGSGRNVLKFLPPLIIDEVSLASGMEIVRQAIVAALTREGRAEPLTAAK